MTHVLLLAGTDDVDREKLRRHPRVDEDVYERVVFYPLPDHHPGLHRVHAGHDRGPELLARVHPGNSLDLYPRLPPHVRRERNDLEHTQVVGLEGRRGDVVGLHVIAVVDGDVGAADAGELEDELTPHASRTDHGDGASRVRIEELALLTAVYSAFFFHAFSPGSDLISGHSSILWAVSSGA